MIQYPLAMKGLIIKATGYAHFLILSLVMLLVSHVTYAAAPVFGTAAESKYARGVSAPKGKAVIYVYRRNDDGRGVSPTITLNNYVIGRLVPGSFTVWTLAPGQLALQVGGVKSAGYSIRSRAGKIYRFRLTVKQTTAGPEAKLRLMPGSSRHDITGTRLLKNPRAVTALAINKPGRPTTAKKPPKTTTGEPEQEQTQPSEPDEPVIAGGFVVMLKTGIMTLSEDTQFIVGANRSFDSSTSNPLSIEAYYQFSSGLTAGAEIMSYTANFTTTGASDEHDVDVLLIMGNVKQYFRNRSRLQPFIGAGIGFVTTSISGPTISGDTAGLAYQLMGGVEYRNSNVGFFGEIKYISADSESDNNQSVDVSGTGILAGVAFHF